jgi:hypothetical protein
MRQTEITINRQEYILKPNMKAMFMFERIEDKAFIIKTNYDLFMYIYCMIYANNDNAKITADELMHYFEDNPDEFMRIFNDIQDVVPPPKNEDKKKIIKK